MPWRLAALAGRRPAAAGRLAALAGRRPAAAGRLAALAGRQPAAAGLWDDRPTEPPWASSDRQTPPIAPTRSWNPV